MHRDCKTSQNQLREPGRELVSHVWVLNATCTIDVHDIYVYFSPYRDLVSIILSPVLLFCSSIASFFSCSLKSQKRMPDTLPDSLLLLLRRLAPDPSRKRLITTSKAVESRCCSRVERELNSNHLIYGQWQPYKNQYPTWCKLNLRVLRRVFDTQTTDIEVSELPKLTYLNQL